MTIPYIGFANETLGKLPEVQEGDLVECPQCKQKHPLEYGTSNGKKSTLLGFIKCGDESYLAAVAGKLVVNNKADCSGEI